MSPARDRLEEALRVSVKEAERLRDQNRRLREAASEPVAIVGMACRYPGGASSPAALWDLLAAGRDAVGGFPTDRGWDLERLCEPGSERFGVSATDQGGFLDDATGFDPDFFGISPREALCMDPQQRLLLETAWEALEDAGIRPAELRGGEAGVFTGAMYHDYGWGLSPAEERAAYLPTGGSSSLASGRISYVLGLEGPSLSVDTACSSSLVALHLAVRALRRGECSLALAGGATVYSTPSVFIQFSGQRALAPDGRCKAYADGADGIGFSEGVGMLLLERLSDAERHGHPVLATVRGSAVNQDGASNGLTAPNGPSQEAVIRRALEDAGLEPAEVDAVEGHGTGTALGDPVEVGALLAAYGAERREGRPLWLGSGKSNIGHAQAAAGVAGVIKSVLALRAGLLPKTLHVDSPSAAIDWSSGAIELLVEARPWPASEHPRRIGVSSFGATGTNAHLVLEQAPAAESRSRPAAPEPAPAWAGPPLLLPLSAKTEPALAEAATQLAAEIEKRGLELADVATSLAGHKTTFEHRAVLVAEDEAEAVAELRALGGGGASRSTAAGRAASASRAVFVFSGHGAQWPGMGRELLASSTVFAERMRECSEALRPFTGWSVEDVVRQEEGAPALDGIEVVQPVIFSTMVSLAALWRACGVEPVAVVGHSQGEIAAACVAGGLSLADAARVVALRSRMIAERSGRSGLVSITHPVAELEDLVSEWEGRIEIAAVNGPTSAALAGDRETLDRMLAACEERGIRARDIPGAVSATHSVHIEVIREELLEALAPLEPRSGEVAFHSTVTGEPLDTAELDAAYWYRNARLPVRFEQVVRALLGEARTTLIEVSAHPVLLPAMQETAEAVAEGASAAVLGTLRRDEGGPRRFALALAEAHAAGVPLAWERVIGAGGLVRLPTYPFQRRRLWLAANEGAADPRAIGQSPAEHPLLGSLLEAPEADGGGTVLTGRVSLETHPWLADHAAFGTVLLPGTGFLELALRAGGELDLDEVDELAIEAPLVLPEQGAVHLRITVGDADQEGRRAFEIHARPEPTGVAHSSGWERHAGGSFAAPSPATAQADARLADLAGGDWPPPGAQPLDVGDLYAELERRGVEYGPAFQGLTGAWRGGDRLYAEVAAPDEIAGEAGRFALHPALLDAAGHAAIQLALEGEEAGRLPLPFAWRAVRLRASGQRSLRVAILTGEDGAELAICDERGEPVLGVGSLVMRPIEAARLSAAAGAHRALYGLAWRELPITADAGEEGEPPALEDLSDEAVADDRAAAAEELGARVLARMQERLAQEPAPESPLVVLTRGALAVGAEEDAEPAAGALAGLVRAASAEQPGRFALLDSDCSDLSRAALQGALATAADEPVLALREGRLLAPRLERAGTRVEAVAEPLDPERTVLITGGTGGLGTLLARHLVAERGARHLLLVSRSGEAAAGAAELRDSLEALGAAVEIAACDVSERESLARLLDSIPAEHPLGAVFHTAGALADGTLTSQTPESLHRALAPKAAAAWHLHELTAGLELSHFVLYSSVMGVLGSPGQASYAAANAFLDALAAHRRAAGLAGVSLAWGGWGQLSAMLAGDRDEEEMLRAVEQIRQRLGLVPMEPEQALALLDAALETGDAQLVPAAFDDSVLRARAAAGTLPPPLRGMVRARPVSRGSLAESLAGLAAEERQQRVLDLVCEHAAAVLGLAAAVEIDPDTAFKELGFDSLGAVELRNRLVAASGLRLPQTIVFDYPTPLSLARHLAEQAGGAASAVPGPSPAVRPAASEEPIAIVGMACRYPGGADSPQRLWSLLAEGGQAISEFPEDRGWDLERLRQNGADRPGGSYVHAGGFVHDAPLFDPGFFGISPREALAMDPQERSLLESCWEALEDGGIDPRTLQGTDTGVFAGVMYQDYGVSDHGTGPGMTSSGVSGRVAYTFGFEGPAITVDTACSSSLVAMHLAGQALRAGECDLALAGGVTVLSTPSIFVLFSAQRALAPDGRCKPFSERADGTAIAEGTGVVLLERLSVAEANGHPVLATIRGSAVNQDGASNGFTAPNGPSQERVIRRALAVAGLTAAEVDAVEAHGTGTELGDPIEAGALLATYGQEREQPLLLGSVKSNIGHSQAAAGAAGVIKAVMAMREGTLPRSLHAEDPTSKVEWDSGRIELLAEERPWPANGRPRRIGVSSFGASGTNAHMVIEEAGSGLAGADGEEPDDARGAAASPAGPLLLPLSARDEAALGETAKRLAERIEAEPGLAMPDVAHSLASGRAGFELRAAAFGADRAELLAGLAELGRGEPAARSVLGRPPRSPAVAFLFTGQGAQRVGMGAGLHARFPAFASAFDRVCEALDPELGTSLADIVFGRREDAEQLLGDTAFAQPALFALEVALFRQLESYGVRPALLAGHSIGELSAAHVSGVLDLGGAAVLVASRGRLMSALPAGGAMFAIQASEAEAADALDGHEAELALAAVNGPEAVVVSGEAVAAAEVAERFGGLGRKSKRLEVSHAFHSPLIEPMLDEFEQVATSLAFAEPRIPIVSNLTGEVLAAEQATDPSYWVRHVREPVRFADAVDALREEGANAMLELGPGPVLTAMAAECLAAAPGGAEPALVACLRGGSEEPDTLSRALASAHVGGAALDWDAILAGTEPRWVSLPTYPFQRERYWLDPAQAGSGDLAAAGQARADHPLLGAALSIADGEGTVLTGRISLASHGWLADHALAGVAVVPGTALLELALRAAAEVGAEAVEELTLEAPLVLAERGGAQLQVAVGDPGEDGRRPVSIHSRPSAAGDAEVGEERAWACHARGLLGGAERPPPEPLNAWPPRGAEQVALDDLYERLAEHGVEYGPAFRNVRAAWRRGGELWVDLALGEQGAALEAQRYGLHPALLDAAGHVGMGLALAAHGEGAQEMRLPFSWRGVSLVRGGVASLRVKVPIEADGEGLVAFDEAGDPVLSVAAVDLRPVDRSQLAAGARRRLPLHRVEWASVGPAADGGGEAPADVVTIDAGAGMSPPAAARANSAQALALVQARLADDGSGARPLCIQTHGAVAAVAGERPDLGQAPVWGLVRSAQSEHPGRFALLDLDGETASPSAPAAALALAAREPQLALRGGELLVPRLAPVRVDGEREAPRLDPAATVLITGGTGGLGALLARHLVAEHGARSLLLASRSGERAEGAAALREELREAGAEVAIRACDVAYREQSARGDRVGPGQPSAGHGRARGRGRRRRPGRGARQRAPRPGLRPQAGRCLAPARADRRPGSLGLRPLLLRRGSPRRPWAGQLRRGKRLPRRARRPATCAGRAGRLARLGWLGDGYGHDRPARPGGSRPGGAPRPGSDRGRDGARALRRKLRARRAPAGTRCLRPGRPAPRGRGRGPAADPRPPRRRGRALGAGRGPRRAARQRARGGARAVRARAEPGPRRHRARPSLGGGDRSGGGVRRPRLRLAGRGRVAQQAYRRHRPAPAADAGLRLSDHRGGRDPPARARDDGRWRRGAPGRERAAGGAAGAAAGSAGGRRAAPPARRRSALRTRRARGRR